jgi:hypothetical protein
MAAAALVPISAVRVSAHSGKGYQSLNQISYSSLAGQINTLFRVHLSPLQTVELKLLKAPFAPSTPANPGRRLPGDAGNEKFSLIFRGPKDELISPAIYRFEHEKLGAFEMYIGQIGPRNTDGVRYEIVFNRPAFAAPVINLEK